MQRGRGSRRWLVAIAVIVVFGTATGIVRFGPDGARSAAAQALAHAELVAAAYFAGATGSAPSVARPDPVRGGAAEPARGTDSRPALANAPEPSHAAAAPSSLGPEPPLVPVMSLPVAHDGTDAKGSASMGVRTLAGARDSAHIVSAAAPVRRRTAPRPSAPSHASPSSPETDDTAGAAKPLVANAAPAVAAAPAAGSLDDLIRKAVEAESKKRR